MSDTPPSLARWCTTRSSQPYSSSQEGVPCSGWHLPACLLRMCLASPEGPHLRMVGSARLFSSLQVLILDRNIQTVLQELAELTDGQILCLQHSLRPHTNGLP